MAVSILIGFFYFLLVLLSGWLKVLRHSFWPGYIFGNFLIILLVLKAGKISAQNGNGINTVGTCGSAFIVGSLVGLIIGLFI